MSPGQTGGQAARGRRLVVAESEETAEAARRRGEEVAEQQQQEQRLKWTECTALRASKRTKAEQGLRPQAAASADETQGEPGHAKTNTGAHDGA